ncbi:hypothetical protein GCM10010910_29370 [Microbacterium nanhaiense]|uniref:Signal peptidase I n=1 Tax=Microbacterium nanhaiense TaxID=1301026 RepID=A0ABQ2N588_9MICO|nr:signal peptidase I [Microbacterium nanhaiense]GGO67486.1 hypothetical protein GCM10010910_29370 [Microbacterium nanhaiense]
MQSLRRISLAVLWALAGVGGLCALIWGATAAGFIQPLVVISGSMEPEIMTGDLLVDTRVQAHDLRVGDVVSLPNPVAGELVTHRIERIEPDGDSGYTITMKGDNNEFTDAVDYAVDGEVWAPAVQVPGWGLVLMRMTAPAVAVPLLAGLLGLLGLALLIPKEETSPRTAVA